VCSILKEGLPSNPHISIDYLATLSESVKTDHLLFHTLLELSSLLSSVSKECVEVHLFELLKVTLGNINDDLSQMVLSL
jgi:hypothetical protein